MRSIRPAACIELRWFVFVPHLRINMASGRSVLLDKRVIDTKTV